MNEVLIGVATLHIHLRLTAIGLIEAISVMLKLKGAGYYY
jgi:hypothetical protein